MNTLIIKLHSAQPLSLPTTKLAEQGFIFYLLANNDKLLNASQKEKIKVKKIWVGPEPKTKTKLVIFFILSPLIFMSLFLNLIYFRFFKKTKILFLEGLIEKILTTLPAKLLGFKNFWQENKLLTQEIKFIIFRPLFYLYARLAMLIVMSEFQKKELIQKGIPEEKIKIIYPGLDLEKYKTQDNLFGQLAERSFQKTYIQKFILGAAGELTKDSGIEYLLNAFSKIREIIPHIQLIIVGEGQEKQKLIWLNKQLGLENQVRFAGQEKDTYKWLEHFNLFIYPLISPQAFEHILLEVEAAGKPIIAFKIGSVSEIVENTQTGTLIEAGNTEMLAQAIINLFHHPDWLEQMGEKARWKVEEKFNEKRMVEEYKKMISNK